MSPARLAALIVLAALMAGCSGDPDDGGPATTGDGPVAPGGSPATDDGLAGASAAAGTGLLAEQWVFPECRQYRFILKQERGAANEGMAPDHEAAGIAAVDLTLRVSDCDSLVQGNRSVQKPFRWAIVHQPLLRMSAEPNDLDWFVREIIVPDAEVAARLSAFGLPALTGEVSVTLDDGIGEAIVTGPSLRYTAQFVDEPAGDEVDQTRRDLLRGGTDDRWFWMQLDLRRSLAGAIDRPATVAADGGYLAGALPAGTQPATVAISTEALVASFVEQRS